MFIYTPKETHKEKAPQTWQILERNVSQEAEGYSSCLTLLCSQFIQYCQHGYYPLISQKCPISDLIWTVFNMEFE